ncbi:MAG: ECF transporter S component [Erysipelotrichaceae bacterium]
MKEKKFLSVKNMAIIAILSSLSAVLMLFEFPLPFIAPPFYGIDFSEIPALIGGFALGPLAGVVIECLKIVIKLLLKPTSTAFVGEIGNILIGLCLILPATMIYRKLKSRNGALLGLVVGTVCMAIGGALTNLYFLLPAFSTLMNIPIDDFVAMGTAIFPIVTSPFTFVLFCTAPFNLIKGSLVSVIVALIYKQMSILIKKI